MNRLGLGGCRGFAALVGDAGALDGDLEVLAFDLDFVHAGLGDELDEVLDFVLGHGQ